MKKLKLTNAQTKGDLDVLLLGEYHRVAFYNTLKKDIINRAWELFYTIKGKDTKVDWESPDTTPKLTYQEHRLSWFIWQKRIICGIGFDVDNVYFFDIDGNWVELDELGLDGLCDALNNIDANLQNFSKINAKKLA